MNAIVIAASALVALSLIVAHFTAQMRLLKRCLGVSGAVALLFLLPTPLMPIGVGLLVISGVLVMLGMCKECDSKQTTAT